MSEFVFIHGLQFVLDDCRPLLDPVIQLEILTQGFDPFAQIIALFFQRGDILRLCPAQFVVDLRPLRGEIIDLSCDLLSVTEQIFHRADAVSAHVPGLVTDRIHLADVLFEDRTGRSVSRFLRKNPQLIAVIQIQSVQIRTADEALDETLLYIFTRHLRRIGDLRERCPGIAPTRALICCVMLSAVNLSSSVSMRV